MKKTRILFLCTGNSCRSQMAEGFARALKKDEISAFSAGVSPREEVDPRAVKVMAEAGVDISAQRPKSLEQVAGLDFDYVITLCGHAKESCPVFPGNTKVVHFGFEDPPRLAAEAKTEEEALEHYRRIRDEIKEFVLGLPGNLENAAPGSAVILNVGEERE